MGHNRQRLSAEELLMISWLLLSTSAISIWINMKPRREFEPQIIWIDSTAAPTFTTVNHDVASARPSDAGNLPSELGLGAVDPFAPLSGTVAELRGDDGFVPMPARHSHAADTNFARAELSRASNSSRGDRCGEIRVVKGIYVDGTRAGHLEITVSASGDLIVDCRHLKALLAKPGLESRWGGARELADGPVNFRTLRDNGIDLRYSLEDDSFRIFG
jgi:hypothetical protein